MEFKAPLQRAVKYCAEMSLLMMVERVWLLKARQKNKHGHDMMRLPSSRGLLSAVSLRPGKGLCPSGKLVMLEYIL